MVARVVKWHQPMVARVAKWHQSMVARVLVSRELVSRELVSRELAELEQGSRRTAGQHRRRKCGASYTHGQSQVWCINAGNESVF